LQKFQKISQKIATFRLKLKKITLLFKKIYFYYMLEKIEIGNIAEDALEFGRLFIDIRAKRVKIEGLVIPLTKSEFEILFTLASEPLRVYSRLQIINAIRDNPACITEATIDVHISHLRKKLGRGQCCILNRQGFGYEFDPSMLIDSKEHPAKDSA
jgi:DNA-binding response OmpR family regulator